MNSRRLIASPYCREADYHILNYRCVVRHCKSSPPMSAQGQVRRCRPRSRPSAYPSIAGVLPRCRELALGANCCPEQVQHILAPQARRKRLL
jgi:hypothetical protein